jgi:hypothetical protein
LLPYFNLQSAKVSISRDYALESIIKNLEFLIEIPGSPAGKLHTEKEGKSASQESLHYRNLP